MYIDICVYIYICRYIAYRHREVYQVDCHSFRAVRFRHQLPGRGAYERIFPDLNFQVRRDTGSASGGTTLRNAAQRDLPWDKGYVRKARLISPVFWWVYSIEGTFGDQLRMVTIY